MVARNDITGDAIQTKGNSNSYRDNYDAIFRKKSKDEVLDVYNEERLVSKFDKESLMSPSVEQMKQGTCGCGRSPTGDCCGWHGLTQEDFEQRKELYETGKVDLHGKDIK
jgi:hypothetical protein